jgi:hypothetical protein
MAAPRVRNDIRSAADTRHSVAANESWRAAMLGMYFQPAIAGVYDIYLKSRFDLANLLSELGGRRKDSSAASDFVRAGYPGRRRLTFGLFRRDFLNNGFIRVLVDRCGGRDS